LKQQGPLHTHLGCGGRLVVEDCILLTKVARQWPCIGWRSGQLGKLLCRLVPLTLDMFSYFSDIQRQDVTHVSLHGNLARACDCMTVRHCDM